jgi:hypothetical protein
MLDDESMKKLGEKTLFEEVAEYKKEIRKIYPDSFENENENENEDAEVKPLTPILRMIFWLFFPAVIGYLTRN